jgi:hypothetical protein
MAIHRLEITLNEDDWARLNELRGHEPRASFVKRVLRQSFSLTLPENAPLIPAPPSMPDTKLGRKMARVTGIPVEEPVVEVPLPKIARRRQF